MSLDLDPSVIWRDFTTDGIPASGAYGPRKVEIRQHLSALRQAVIALLADADPGLALPNLLIRATDTGAGTPNAIQATTNLTIPLGDAAALIALNIFEPNTASPVTVSFNGGSALTIKTNTGSDVVAGGLRAGALVLGLKLGSAFRLVTDQASQAVLDALQDALAGAQAAQSGAESARAGSEAARDIAAGYASDAVSQGNVPIYATAVGMAALSVPGGITAIRTNGYAVPGDGGGALYRRVASEPWHAGKLQSSDGAWWEMVAGGRVSPAQFGAFGHEPSVLLDDMNEEYDQIQNALDFVGLTGGSLEFGGGRRYRVDSPLFARITRQQDAPEPLVADAYFSDYSNFRIGSWGIAQIVAGSAMVSVLTLQYNSNVVGGAENFVGPLKSVCTGLMVNGNELAEYCIDHDYTGGSSIYGCVLFGAVRGPIHWTGSSTGASVHSNFLKGNRCIICDEGGGGDLHVGPNDYYFPSDGGAAVYIEDSGNITIDAGTVNSESIVGCVGVDIVATEGKTVRHVKVRGSEWSGCLIGVRARTFSPAERIYGLIISEAHATSGSGFDRPFINPGTIADLEHCDEFIIGPVLANGRNLSSATETPFITRRCRDGLIVNPIVGNYSGPAWYDDASDNVNWLGGTVRDVGRSGAGGAIFDLDGSTNCRVNPSRVVQSSSSYAQIGIIERAGCSGNASDDVEWVGVATPSFKLGSTDGRFRRHRVPFAEGKIEQTSGGATLTTGHNIGSVSRPSIGRTLITFTTPHPDGSYLPFVTGVDCKVWVEAPGTDTMQVLMLDLSDNPVDRSFVFEVRSSV